MPYVSAKFVRNEITGATDTNIEALDDQGRIWVVPGMDCQVGDWLEYINNGGSVEPYEAQPKETGE